MEGPSLRLGRIYVNGCREQGHYILYTYILTLLDTCNTAVTYLIHMYHFRNTHVDDKNLYVNHVIHLVIQCNTMFNNLYDM